MIEILKDDLVIRELIPELGNEADLLKRAKLDAEIMNRDLDGVFSARIKPEEVPSEPA
jgi:hypothetical protein